MPSYSSPPQRWPPGDGEMAELVRTHPWHLTRLGPIEKWSSRLKAAVEQVLASPTIASLACGVDRLLIYNDAAACLYGDRHPDALGRPLAHVFPESYSSVASFYARVFSGESVHVPAQALNIVGPKDGFVFDAYLSPVRDDKGTVFGAIMFGFEIGDRLRAQAALREVSERQAFLLELSDALRPLADAGKVMRCAARMLGKKLNASRVFYANIAADGDTAEVDSVYADGIQEGTGRYSLDAFAPEFVPEWRAGRVTRTNDVEADPRFTVAQRAAYASVSARAAIGVPLVKDGRLVAILGVNASSPRDWTDQEIALVADAAERTWASVARARAEGALCESEAKHRALFETMGQGYVELELLYDGADRAIDHRYLELNPAFERLFGIPAVQAVGRTTSELFSEFEAWWHEALDRVARSGKPERLEYSHPPDRWFEGLIYPRGGNRVAALYDEVTQRKRDELALRESEARHRLLVESWAQTTWETNTEGVVVADSPSWRAYTGQTLDEWLGYGWLDAVHPDDRAYAERQWREAVAAGGLVNAEFRLRSPDGGWRWTNVRAAPVLDEQGHMEKWVGMNIDIDARKRAEAALTESEKKYRSLFESMDEAYAVVEVLKNGAGEWEDFRFLEVNPAFMKHTDMPYPVGQTATELLGSPNPRWTQLYGQALDSGEAIRVEESEAVLGLVFDLNIFSLDRDRNHVAVLFTNITDRKRSERALRENQERQAFLLQFSDGVRPLTDAVEVQERAVIALGTVLSVDRCYYAETDWDRGVATVNREYRSQRSQSLVGEHPIGRFEHLHALTIGGEAVICHDIATHPVLADHADQYREHGIQAMMVMPLVKRGRVEATMTLTSECPRRWTESEIELLTEVAERTWVAVERTRAEQALNDSEGWLQTLMEGVPQLVWRAGAPGSWTWAGPQWVNFTGQREPDSHGWGWLEAVHPEDRDRARENWSDATDNGEFRADYRIWNAEGQRYRWFQTRAQPVRDDGGNVVEWLGTSTDVDDLRTLQERQQLLLGELQHRVRNVLAVVRSIFKRTLDAGGTMGEMAAHFTGRLDSLARTQVVVTQNPSGHVDLENLVRDELLSVGVDDSQKLSVAGPRVRLNAGATEALGLAIHELTTNSLKYGALKVKGAGLEVSWTVDRQADGERWLNVIWEEHGMPVVPIKPVRYGFGRELIEDALPYQLNARTTMEFGGGGVRCTIALPLDEAPAVEDEAQ